MTTTIANPARTDAGENIAAVKAAPKRPPVRKVVSEPQTTEHKILKVAYREFARHGFAGARVDRITKVAKVNPRMIYHHFGSKEKLYQAVLAESYADIRSKEAKLNIDHLEPIEGVMALFDFTFEHFEKNPDFIWLLTNENLMRGKFVLSFSTVTDITSTLRNSLEHLVRVGQEKGVLSANADALQIYVTIASLSWFHLGNAYTLSAMFGRDLNNPQWRSLRKEHARHILRSYLATGAAPPEELLTVAEPSARKRT